MNKSLDEKIKERQNSILESTKLPKQVFIKDLLNERKNDKLKIAELEVKLEETQILSDSYLTKSNSYEKLTNSLKKELLDKIKYNNLLLEVLGTQLVENSNQTNEINRLLTIANDNDYNIIKKIFKKNDKDPTKTI